MKTKILLTIIVVTFLAACSKDKYQTRPQLTFKKVNTKQLQRNQSLIFTIEVTDAEGDIQDTMFIQKISRTCAASNLTAKYLMPKFTPTKNFIGNIEVTYGYNDIPPKCFPKNDTATFRFWIKDNAKNVSDTASVSEIAILQ